MQISPIVPNTQNHHRNTAEILELGMRLLSNPNKYGCRLLLPHIGCLKMCAVGAFLASENVFCTYLTYFEVNF